MVLARLKHWNEPNHVERREVSALVMGQVWNLDLPQNEQSVLLALADHADHTGGNVFPSNGLVAWKIGVSEDTVRRAKRKLEERNILVKINERVGRTTVYRIDIAAGQQKPAYNPPQIATPSKLQGVANDPTPPAQLCYPTPRIAVLPITVKEPSSLEPSSIPADAAPVKKGKVKDGRHQEFFDLWWEAYQQQFGRVYVPNGAADGSGLKRLLKATKLSAGELMAIATRAWSKKGKAYFRCEKAVTIKDFCASFTQIVHELETIRPGDIPARNGHAVTHRPADDRNDPLYYAPGEKRA